MLFAKTNLTHGKVVRKSSQSSIKKKRLRFAKTLLLASLTDNASFRVIAVRKVAVMQIALEVYLLA